MKINKNLFLIAGMALLATSVFAADLTYWSGGGTDVGNTLCYTVVSRSGVKPTPVLTYLNATSDKAASVVQFYNAGVPVAASLTNSTTSIFVSITNANTAFTTNGGIIIINHVATDTYERRILTGGGTGTNLVVTVAPTSAVLPKDLIYQATTAGSIPVGAANLSLVGPGIYSGTPGRPLLLEVDGTSACQLNAAAADYK